VRDPFPPVAAVLSFIDRINHCDVEGLGRLMTDDHELRILDEVPTVGREANIDAWRGYMASFPEYIIYPYQIAEHNGGVAVLGSTTGSHLGLPDEQEATLRVLWVSEVRDGKLSLWSIVPDTAETRAAHGLG
jgi:hypothetical protein